MNTTTPATPAPPVFTCALLENHKDEIAGILHCADRILIAGSLVDCSHPKANLYKSNLYKSDLLKELVMIEM